MDQARFRGGIADDVNPARRNLLREPPRLRSVGRQSVMTHFMPVAASLFWLIGGIATYVDYRFTAPCYILGSSVMLCSATIGLRRERFRKVLSPWWSLPVLGVVAAAFLTGYLR